MPASYHWIRLYVLAKQNLPQLETLNSLKVRCFFCITIIIAFHGYGQTLQSKFNYDIKKIRLLIHTSGQYIFAANQGILDWDSSMVLACRAQNLPLSLAYDEGYNDGSGLPANSLIEKDDIESARAVLQNLKGIDRIKLLLELAGYYLFKPGNKKPDLDNAFIFIQSVRQISDSLKILRWQNQSWLILAKYFEQAGELKKSKECFLHVLTESRKSGNKMEIAEALDNLGTFLPLEDSLKVTLFTEAKELYSALSMKEKAEEMLMRIINAHFWGGKMDLAKQELYQDLAFLKSINFKHTHYTETTISYVELMQGNDQQGMFYALESIKTMEATADTVFADYFTLRLGDIYQHMGRYEDALALYKKSINSLSVTHNSGIWYKSFLSIIRALLDTGKPNEALSFIESINKRYSPENEFDKMLVARYTADCYKDIGNFGTAEKYYQEMAAVADKLSSVETSGMVANCYVRIALFYANTSHAAQSQIYLNKLMLVPPGQIDIFTKQETELTLFKIDSLSGKYLSSVRHYQVYKKISDSIDDVAKNRQVEELQIKYETSKKEQNITLLKNQSKLQQGELKTGTHIRNLALGGVFLLVAVIGLLYNRYRLKQRSNNQLEKLVKEKEGLIEDKEWLLKEIHHRVKNNLQIVMSLMNIQSSYLESGEALDAIRESQSRMNAMLLIHQKLYQSSSLASISMLTYVDELVKYILDTFGQNLRIKPVLDISPIDLDVSQAVPIGLILNEAITNAIKYAFPKNRKGELTISLQPGANNTWILSIKDNGVGLPEGFSFSDSGSIGITLMKTLTEQISGILSLKNNGGAEVMITFKKDISVKNHFKSELEPAAGYA